MAPVEDLAPAADTDNAVPSVVDTVDVVAAVVLVAFLSRSAFLRH